MPMTTESAMEQRIRRLEDIECVKNLTARYADAVDKGWAGKTLDLAVIPDIFAADARWTSVELGTTIGANAIAAALPAATAAVEFAMHAFLNPIVTVDGDTAAGSWLMWIASVYNADPGTVHMSADMTYTRTAAGWRIQTVNIHNGLRIPGRTA
jgi:hypothetical protein